VPTLPYGHEVHRAKRRKVDPEVVCIPMVPALSVAQEPVRGASRKHKRCALRVAPTSSLALHAVKIAFPFKSEIVPSVVANRPEDSLAQLEQPGSDACFRDVADGLPMQVWLTSLRDGEHSMTRVGIEPTTYGLTCHHGFRRHQRIAGVCSLDFALPFAFTRSGRARQVSTPSGCPAWLGVGMMRPFADFEHIQSRRFRRAAPHRSPLLYQLSYRVVPRP